MGAEYARRGVVLGARVSEYAARRSGYEGWRTAEKVRVSVEEYDRIIWDDVKTLPERLQADRKYLLPKRRANW